MPISTPSSIEPLPQRSIRANSSSASSSIRSVRASTKYEPPSGSMTFGTPVSYAMTCWVRSASFAASAVGERQHLIEAFVCRDCVPPSTAASASMAVRTTLFIGCWAVSDTPAVCVWNRSRSESASFAP